MEEDDDAAASVAAPAGQFALSRTLVSDGEPVRSLACLGPPPPAGPPDGSLVLATGSGGGIVSSHVLPPDLSAAVLTSLQPGGDGTRHPHVVGAMLALPPEGGGNGGYVTGCRDGILRVFDARHGRVAELPGHTGAVTSLAWLETSGPGPALVVSGSWDGTARIWDGLGGGGGGRCVAVLPGHENTVSVAGIGPDRLATTSAGVAEGTRITGHRVRLWDCTDPSRPSPAGTVSDDHDGPIRAVAYDPDLGRIVTASNDGTVRVRDGGSGRTLDVLVHPSASSGGQPPLLLDVAVLGPGRYAAAAEDGTVAVWGSAGGTGATSPTGAAPSPPQMLSQPGTVWAVLPLPNGDLATACQDGHVRIYSTVPARAAPEAETEALAAAVAEHRSRTAGGPTPEEVAALPRWEMAALNRGRSEGQVGMFSRGGVAIAAQWSEASGTWIEVGEVTGSSGQNAGEIGGTRYDHVFPIEIDVAGGGGVQELRIGYNDGENAFAVAQKFIDEHMLDQGYLAQIADYVTQRAGQAGPTLGGGAAAGGATGAGSAPGTAAATPAAVPARTYAHLPVRGYKSFEAGTSPATLAKIVAKAREFAAAATPEGGAAAAAAALGPALDSLAGTLAETSRYHATQVSDEELMALAAMLEGWDGTRSFPAADLARLAVVHPDASRAGREGIWSTIVRSSLSRALEDPAAVAFPMLAMRLCANCFRGGRGSRDAAASHLPAVLRTALDLAGTDHKNVRLAIATAVLNAAAHAHSSLVGAEAGTAAVGVLDAAAAIAATGRYEAEATVRTLAGVGTVLLLDGEGGERIRTLARRRDVASMARRAAEGHGEAAGAVADEIGLILGGGGT